VLPATTMKHARHSVVNIRFADGRPGWWQHSHRTFRSLS
jgi:hypothetical protein